MPEMQPSCLKPTDTKVLSRPAVRSTAAKAQRYDELRPGLTIPAEQKAERLDLMQHRHNNGIVNRKRRGSGSSITVPNTADIWDENGKLKP